METNRRYRVDSEDPLSPNPSSIAHTRHLVLNHSYTQTVKEFMMAMISRGYAYDDFQQLSETAIAATDTLIEKAGEKL